MESWIECEIYIDHKQPISISVLTEMFDAIDRVVLAIAVQQLSELNLRDMPDGERLREFAQRLLAGGQQVIWLESCESGSSKFRLKIRQVAKLLLEGILVSIAMDVAKAKIPEQYEQLISQMDNMTDRMPVQIAEGVDRAINGMLRADGMKVEASVPGDRIRFVVYPGMVQTGGGYFELPPR